MTNGQFKCHVGVLAVLFAIDAIVGTRQSGAAVLFAVHQSSEASFDQCILVRLCDLNRSIATATNSRGVLFQELANLDAESLGLGGGQGIVNSCVAHEDILPLCPVSRHNRDGIIKSPTRGRGTVRLWNLLSFAMWSFAI